MEKYNLTQTGAEVQEILNTAIPQSELTEEVGRAQGAEQTLQDKIDAEELRAKAAESDLEQADTVLQGNIDAEELRAKAAEKQNADEIDVIEEKIPTEASSSNQLADKAFVNSSIASNTATYRGSFNQVNDLHLTLEATEADIATALESVIDNADNNDYCYIQVPVSESAPTEIAQVDRYKFNGTTWAYEYTLNNSGFTADQWAALNSAITSGLVAKLSALPNMAELTALLAGKQNLLNFDNVPTTGSNNPVTSGGVKTAIDDEKTRAQAAEQANNLLITQINGKIPSDATSENKLVDKAYVDAADATMQSAIEGILALIPEAATALNQLADKAFVNSSIATNTGTFKGTYNVVLDLELFYDATHAQIALMLASKITSAKNNDYCYVQVPNSNEDPTSINHTDRYKYNGTAWAYEYTLNNSGFTTAQWAAINSGITELLKNKLVDLPTATELAALLNAKQNTLTFDTAPTPNSTNPVTSDGIHAAINVEKERAEAAEEELDTNKADKATTLAGYGITDAYTKNEVNNMITTPNQQYVTVATYASLPASGSKDTIYRVSNYNGANSQVDNTVYSEYAWNGTQYVFLCVKSQIEEVFDITVYNSNTKYADLAAALGVDGANIPATLRRGGMSVKFVQSSDNKYVQFRCKANAFTTDTNEWIFEGDDVLVENPEFLGVLLDNEGKIILAIEKDGNVVFGASVPKQIVDFVNKALENTINYIENPQFLYVLIDNDGRFLLGIEKDGNVYYGAGVPKQVKEAIEKAILDSSGVYRNNITPITQFDTENVTLQKSRFVNKEQDTIDLMFDVPQMSAQSYNIVNVSNESELNAAITEFNNGDDVLIMLTDDIAISSTKTINSNKELIIEGNKHTIYQKLAEYTPVGYMKGKAYADAIFDYIEKTFISDKLEPVSFCRTKFYDAASRVEFVEEVDNNNIYRFLLPNELSELTITSEDNVYINLSWGFQSSTLKVVNTSDGYVYFIYNGRKYVGNDVNRLSLDEDYHYANIYTSFFFINLEDDGKGMLLKDSKLIFPTGISKLYDAGGYSDDSGGVRWENPQGNAFQGFIINNGAKVKFSNISFIGASNGDGFIQNNDSIVYIENCCFNGFIGDVVLSNKSLNTPYTSIVNSTFKNLQNRAIFMHRDTVCKVVNCNFKDTGLTRNQKPAIIIEGIYYIANNIIEDYGYSAIYLGVEYHVEPNEDISKGIVERNIIRQTTEYLRYANVKTLFDSGAIYLRTLHTNCVIRYNRIVNHVGRGQNMGIYCDDGACNFKIYSNLIFNTPYKYAIHARYQPINAGRPANINKVIAQNIVTGSILIAGDGYVENNGCLLGHNILTEPNSEIEKENIQDEETQYYSFNTQLIEGMCCSTFSLFAWNI